MPTYVYECETCQTQKEEVFSMKEKPDTIPCEKCGKPAPSVLTPSNFKVNGYNASNNYSYTSKDRRK